MATTVVSRAAFLACFLSLFLPVSAAAADKSWAEVRSPHFRVLSDGSEKDARAVAQRFEQMRTAFATALPSLRLDSQVPMLILAIKDESSFKTLFPEMSKRKGVKPGGFFARGSEKTFAVVRLDVVRRQAESKVAGDGYAVVYHEYTHSLLNANFRWLPLWLDEGLAEFFGNTQFKDGKIYLGAPNVRAQYTRGLRLLPLETLIGITTGSPEYLGESNAQLFYSESWGLVHSLLVPSVNRGKRLRDFLNRLEKGVGQKQAFREAIGDFKEVEEQLNTYLDSDMLDAFVFNNPSANTEAEFAFRRLSPAESNAELGTAQIWLHENAAAHQRLEQALRDEPRSALAAESMGFLKFEEGKDSEAVANFERAAKADGKLYLAAYYRAMLSPAERADDESGRTAVRAALSRVVELNPDFAPAYVQLASGYIQERNFEKAIPLAVKAQQLQPSKAGYHILIGNILHALGRDGEAASVARYVAERWQDADHDEAVELWQKLPAGVRQGVELEKRPSLPGARMISGKVSSVSCREKDRMVTLVIDGSTFALRANDEKMKIGFSNTIWYGADHFNRCRHLEGLRAVIQYTSSSGSLTSGDLLQLDLYDSGL